MKRIASQTGTVLSVLVVSVLFVLCIGFVYLRLTGLSLFVVTGGSMEPAVHKGALAFVEPVAPSKVRQGDIITFVHYDQVTTHRVISMETTPTGLVFKTKGDANVVADPDPMVFPSQVGLVRGSIPTVGYLVAYAQYYWRTGLTAITAIVFFGCAALLVFRRETSVARTERRGLRPILVRAEISDAEAVWNAHVQWVRQSTAQRIRAA
jgi:signal peptidase